MRIGFFKFDHVDGVFGDEIINSDGIFVDVDVGLYFKKVFIDVECFRLTHRFVLFQLQQVDEGLLIGVEAALE
jgi:hypothetical protein